MPIVNKINLCNVKWYNCKMSCRIQNWISAWHFCMDLDTIVFLFRHNQKRNIPKK